MKYSILLSLSFFFLLILGSCNSNRVPVEQIETMTKSSTDKVSNNRLERMANAWVGHFSNKKHIESGKTEMTIEQELIGRRIWKKSRINEHWIYTGWYPANSYANPLATSIAEITKIAPDTALITFYRLPKELKEKVDPYEWAKPNPFEGIERVDLLSNGEDCGCYIVKGQKGGYQLIAKGACYDDISDQLKYYIINATMKSDRIAFNTRLLDADQKEMVHYQNNVFYKMNRKELERKYVELPLTAL